METLELVGVDVARSSLGTASRAMDGETLRVGELGRWSGEVTLLSGGGVESSMEMARDPRSLYFSGARFSILLPFGREEHERAGKVGESRQHLRTGSRPWGCQRDQGGCQLEQHGGYKAGARCCAVRRGEVR